MNKEFIEIIKKRKDKLEQVNLILKTKFIGIDDIIDKIIDNISLWYITPEIQFRPLIINLWGITGVGKTDLVRTLVRELDFTDKFLEIQMDVEHDYTKNIENYLESSGIDNNESAVLLLDEFQRFRTIDENGHIVKNKHFNDVWMLLSDGKFQNNSQRKREIMEMLLEEMYWEDQRENPPSNKSNSGSDIVDTTESKKIKESKFKTSHWTANKFKKMLSLQTSVEDIMKMSLNERVILMNDTLKTESVNEGKSFEKLLIFISGNIDDAFQMAESVEDSECDADIMHELSKRVNVVRIKNSLSKQFKPEQIARLGNNHIIYPCLDKKAYQTIIKMNCQNILDGIADKHGVRIELDEKIYEIIYRNGVFPSQGVRPAISTVFNLLGSNLPYFLYNALICDAKYFRLNYEKKELFTIINEKRVNKGIILELDEIRNNKSIDEKMLVLVHEIGHALIYALLFKTPPKQIITNSSGLSAGFVVNHDSIDNKTFIKDKIAIYLGGLVAEELVFGEEFKSAGSQKDILFATDSAGRYVRAYGMHTTISHIAKKQTLSNNQTNYDIDKTNDEIEGILADGKKRALGLINTNIKVYKSLLKHAMKTNSISIEDFLEICNNYDMNLVQKEIRDKMIYSYDKKLNDFLK